MKTKLSVLAALALFTAATLPTAAYAWNGQRGAGMGAPGYGYHMGSGYHAPGYHMPPNAQMPGYAAPMAQLTPDQQAAFEKNMSSFQEQAYALGTQLSAKQMELHYLSQNSKTDPKTISNLVNEVTALQTKLHELRVKTADSLQADLNIDSNQAYALLRGYGQGGYGNRMYGPHHAGGRHYRR